MMPDAVDDFLHDDSGSYLIEVAAVLTPFMMLLFGIFGLTIALAGYGSASYAVAVGARYASIHSSTSLAPAATTDVAAVVNPLLFMPNATASVLTTTYTGSVAPIGSTVGDIVCVKLTWSQPIKAPGYSRTWAIHAQAYRVITR